MYCAWFDMPGPWKKVSPVCTMSASTFRMCCSARLGALPSGIASRAWRRNCSVLARAIARVPAPARGPKSGEIRGRGRRCERAREPALLQVLGALRCRVPDLDRTEMRQIRFRIAHTLQHGELAGATPVALPLTFPDYRIDWPALRGALSQAAGCTGPLNRCSIYGNKEAGAKLNTMLAMRLSPPWPEALALPEPPIVQQPGRQQREGAVAEAPSRSSCRAAAATSTRCATRTSTSRGTPNRSSPSRQSASIVRTWPRPRSA